MNTDTRFYTNSDTRILIHNDSNNLKYSPIPIPEANKSIPIPTTSGFGGTLCMLMFLIGSNTNIVQPMRIIQPSSCILQFLPSVNNKHSALCQVFTRGAFTQNRVQQILRTGYRKYTNIGPRNPQSKYFTFI